MRWIRGKYVLLIVGLLLVGGAALVRAVSAQTLGDKPGEGFADLPVRTQIVIPGSEVEATITGVAVGRVRDLADYLNVVYNFLVSIVGVVAAVMMMVAGFQYLTAGGDAGRTKAAKEKIGNALIGMILAFSSYLILNTINPELVKLKVPELGGIRTVFSFLPFCDTLAIQSNVQMDTIVMAKTLAGDKVQGGCRYCGCPGYLEKSTTVSGTSTALVSKIWCIMRGTEYPRGSDETGSGCGYHNVPTGEVGTDNDEDLPKVCLPNLKYSGAELDTIFNKKGGVPHIGRCQDCTEFDRIDMNELGYPTGDQGCYMWANVANNGRVDDNLFDLKHKQDIRFVTERKKLGSHGGVDHGLNRIYYCGWSDNHDRCVLAEIDCDPDDRYSKSNFGTGGVSSCDHYDDEYIYWKETYDKGLNMYWYDEHLNSWAGGSYLKHLGPICSLNPCGISGKCGQGFPVKALQAIGSTGGGTATVLKDVTLGLYDPGECDD